MKTVLVLTIVLLSSYGAYWLLTLDEREFRDYSTAWFEGRGMQPPAFDCFMNRTSGVFSRDRTGQCHFAWPLNDLPLLEMRLFLKVKAEKSGDKQGCSANSDFSPSVASVVQYSTDKPPPPIFSGNTNTSLLGLYFNKFLEKGCIDLEYPYG